MPNFAVSADYCNYLLISKPNFFKLLKAFHIEQSMTDDGVIVDLKSNQFAPIETKTLEIPFTLYPINKKKTSLLIDEQNQYRFMNVGSRMLRLDYDVVAREFEKINFDPKINYRVIIKFTGDRLLTYQQLNRIRWLVHEAVLNTYIERKPYLKLRDLGVLKAVNIFSDNSDVFAIFDEPSRSFRDLTDEEIKNKLLATLQISYLHDHNFKFIDFLGDMDSNGGLLPFEHRLTSSQKLQFKSILEKNYSNKKTAEFTRFAKLRRLSPQVNSFLLLQALESAMMNGVDVLLANADDYTSRLFKHKFGFTEIFSYVDKGNAKEYILAISKDEFSKSIELIRESIRSLQTRSVLF